MTGGFAKEKNRGDAEFHLEAALKLDFAAAKGHRQDQKKVNFRLYTAEEGGGVGGVMAYVELGGKGREV